MSTTLLNIPTLQDFIAFARNAGFSRTDRFSVGIHPPFLMSKGQWQVRDLALLCEDASFPSKTIATRTLRIHGLNEQRAHTLDYGNNITFTFIVDQSWQTRLFFEEWLRLCIGESSANDSGISRGPLREVEFYDNYQSEVYVSALAPIGSTPSLSSIGINALGALVSSAEGFVTSKINIPPPLLKGNLISEIGSSAAQFGLGTAERTVFSQIASIVPEPPTVPAEVAIYNILLHECFPISMDAQPMSSNTPNQFHRLKITFAYKYYTTQQQLPEHTN
jgi:hypothetical protein